MDDITARMKQLRLDLKSERKTPISVLTEYARAKGIPSSAIR